MGMQQHWKGQAERYNAEAKALREKLGLPVKRRLKGTIARQMYHKAKQFPCCDCGESYPYYVMDLDHRDPATKLFGFSRVQMARRPLDEVAAEIAKCDVVCANCHRKRTRAQHIGLGWLPMDHRQ